jgi:hypothetical protein
MKLHLFLMISAILIVTNSHASDFHIEDRDLIPVPAKINQVIVSSLKESNECRSYLGKVVDLTGSVKKTDWVVISDNGCAWGAANAEIWVVASNAMKNKVVLASSGQSLTIGKVKQNGFFHIAISSGTAGHYSEVLYKFNGKQYVKTHTRLIDFSKPEDCKKGQNHDVCNK